MLGIRWLSVQPGSGYGDASEAYLVGLRRHGVPVTWTPLGWPSPIWDAPYGPVGHDGVNPGRHRDIAGRSIPHDTVLVSSVPLWHEQLALEARGRRLVAYSTWETDRLPTASVSTLNRYDRVLVPSRFNAEVFASSGVRRPVHVVPHIAHPAVPAPAPGSRSPFVFYVVATWTSRKALSDVLRAYVAAFTSADDVRLIVHTTRKDLIATEQRDHEHGVQTTTMVSVARALAGRRNPPAIALSTSRCSRAEIDALHASADCFVLLSRGEGWGLGAFDAAAFGRPVIVTGWGGTPEFLPNDYPYLVDYTLIPTEDDGPDLWWRPEPDERWAKADVEHASRLMRRVYEHREEACVWGSRLQAGVAATYGERRVTARLLQALA